MRKITAKLRAKVHDMFKNGSKGVLTTATCLMVMAGSAIPPAWSAPTSLKIEADEFMPQITSVTMNLKDGDNNFTRSFAVPYDTETGEYAVDFLLPHNGFITLTVNGDQTYKLNSNATFDNNDIVCDFAQNGTNDLYCQYNNYGWRHVVLTENTDHSLKAVFTLGGHSRLSQPDGVLKVLKADGTTSETPLTYDNMSWSVKNLPLQAGDKPYFTFSDGTCLAYPGGFEFKTVIDPYKMTVIQSGENGYPTLTADALASYPAVKIAGEYTLTYFYTINATNNLATLYTTRRDLTLENPVMSVFRDTADGNGEFVALLDFVLLDKKAETVADLKAGDRIYLIYGEESKAVVLDGTDTFTGSHILSDGDASTRLTVDADGTYHLCYDMSDMINGRKLIIERSDFPEKLWYVPGTIHNVYTSNMDKAVELAPIEGKPGQYASAEKIVLSKGDTFFITRNLQGMRDKTDQYNTQTTAIDFYGTNTTGKALTSEFHPGKDVYMLEFTDCYNGQPVHYTVPEVNTIGSTEGYTLFVDFSTPSRRTLRWGDPSGYKGYDYYLIGSDNTPEGILSDGKTVYGVPTDGKRHDAGSKYKFIYHPSSNLYTLTLDELWGKIAIAGSTSNDDDLFRYSALTGNEQINHVGDAYDLFYTWTDEGKLAEYISDEGEKIDKQWFFAINDPECAEDIVTLSNTDNRNNYYYYKNITIVFDPDNNRLWMQNPRKDYVYDPTKDQKDIELPLYIVFVRKYRKADGQYDYNVVKVRPMYQQKREDRSDIPEYRLNEVAAQKTAAPRRAAAAAAGQTTGGTTFGYYTTGTFGSYKRNEIDTTNDGWCHPETWPEADEFTDVIVKPSDTSVEETYNIAYYFFCESDGKAENYDIREMFKKAVHLHCNQDAVLTAEAGYRTGGSKNKAPADNSNEGINGTENETAPQFFNADYTSGIEATMQLDNETHTVADADCGDVLDSHLFAIDTSKPFYVELDRSGSTATARVTRKAVDLYFVSLYRDEDNVLHKFSHKMQNPDPNYPYYFESDYLPLGMCEWTGAQYNNGVNIYEGSTGYCNFFFSAEDGDNIRDVITKSLNASCTSTEHAKQLFTIDYTEDCEVDDSGIKHITSNMRPVDHNYARTFFNTNYEIGSGNALNYFRVVPRDVNHPDEEKLYKVCLWLKGSTKALPKKYLDYLASQQRNAPRRAGAEESADDNGTATDIVVPALDPGIVQLKTYAKEVITSIGGPVAENMPNVLVNGNIITIDGGRNVLIADTQGRVIYSGESYCSIEVESGVYVVNVDGHASKIVVR